MKQQIKAIGAKSKRFDSRINQYQQNQMFAKNQGQFFRRLNKKKITNVKFQILWRQTFQRGMLSERKEHHKNAEWLKDVKKQLEQDEVQDKIDITKDKMMRVIEKLH